jgi:nucleotide-binding universal stress UspA family protein
MYARILVPVDGSEASAQGLKEAIKLARDLNASLRLVHVIDELVMVSSDVATAHVGKVIDLLRTRGESLLKESEAVARQAGVDVDTALVEAIGGPAGEHIVQKAIECRADLIVCGTHGRRGLRRLIMGSDAEYIVRHSPVPVLLVRAQESVSR